MLVSVDLSEQVVVQVLFAVLHKEFLLFPSFCRCFISESNLESAALFFKKKSHSRKRRKKFGSRSLCVRLREPFKRIVIFIGSFRKNGHKSFRNERNTNRISIDPEHAGGVKQVWLSLGFGVRFFRFPILRISECRHIEAIDDSRRLSFLSCLRRYRNDSAPETTVIHLISKRQLFVIPKRK